MAAAPASPVLQHEFQVIHPPPSDFTTAEPVAGRLDARAADALARILGGFVSHKISAGFDVAAEKIVEQSQRFDALQSPPKVRRPLDLAPYIVSVTPRSPSARKPVTRPRGRPTRQLEPSISAAQMRELKDARDFAADLGRPLLCAIDIQPGRLDKPVAGDVGEWLRNGPLRIAAQHMNRAKDRAGRPLGWYAVAMRENYDSADGRNREHAHLVCACPRCDRPALVRKLAAAFPGEGVFLMHDKDLDTYRWDYRRKQMHAHAAGPPGPNRPTPETHHRDEGWPVAPVLGRRIFVSRSLGKPERTRAGWQGERDEQRTVDKVKRAAARARARGDAGLSPMGSPVIPPAAL